MGPRLVTTVVAGMIYGAVLGSFGGWFDERSWQIAISAIKVPMLLLVTFCISLPSFFVLNTILGLRADFGLALNALTTGQAGLTVVLVSLAPYTLLLYISSDSYGLAQFFNAVMFGIAALSGQILVARGYRPLIARNPRHRSMVRFWFVMYSFVAIQMAWVLRPFIGKPGSAVQFFRDDSWGNAYVIFLRMILDGLFR